MSHSSKATCRICLFWRYGRRRLLAVVARKKKAAQEPCARHVGGICKISWRSLLVTCMMRLYYVMLRKYSGFIGIHDGDTVGRLEAWIHDYVGCIIKWWLSLQRCLEAWVHEHVDFMMKWWLPFQMMFRSLGSWPCRFYDEMMAVLQMMFKSLGSLPFPFSSWNDGCPSHDI